ncbi:hypothetical protein CRE_06575 [Caenorhabditis remanei]|uniref:Nuclear transport factor 2-like domain-containing protein n=1 Tax=Caenorhabditis remanei TaxID=31234 RepID=E3M1L9_CAERE|nr:hypothetical protein CRE_06575 [Caenorhabditis remanei]
MPSPAFLLLLTFLSHVASAAHPGHLPPPMELAKDFFERMMTAVDSRNDVAIKKFFSPTALADPETSKIYETISDELAGYSRTIDHAFYDVYKQPKKHTWILNCTVFFRGPHPTYSRKNYDLTLENQYNNPQTIPEAWQVKSMHRKVYSRKISKMDNFNSADAEQMLSHLLSEFMNSIMTRDIGRLERIVYMKDEFSISPTGMQQLFDLFNGNRVEIRSYRIVSSGEVTSTIVFTNQATQVANLFWMVFKNQFSENPFEWKITDMKLMFNDFGPPRDFAGILNFSH